MSSDLLKSAESGRPKTTHRDGISNALNKQASVFLNMLSSMAIQTQEVEADDNETIENSSSFLVDESLLLISPSLFALQALLKRGWTPDYLPEPVVSQLVVFLRSVKDNCSSEDSTSTADEIDKVVEAIVMILSAALMNGPTKGVDESILHTILQALKNGSHERSLSNNENKPLSPLIFQSIISLVSAEITAIQTSPSETATDRTSSNIIIGGNEYVRNSPAVRQDILSLMFRSGGDDVVESKAVTTRANISGFSNSSSSNSNSNKEVKLNKPFYSSSGGADSRGVVPEIRPYCIMPAAQNNQNCMPSAPQRELADLLNAYFHLTRLRSAAAQNPQQEQQQVQNSSSSPSSGSMTAAVAVSTAATGATDKVLVPTKGQLDDAQIALLQNATTYISTIQNNNNSSNDDYTTNNGMAHGLFAPTVPLRLSRGGHHIWQNDLIDFETDEPPYGLAVGDLVDAMDRERNWFESVVVDIIMPTSPFAAASTTPGGVTGNGNHSNGATATAGVRVHFLGWGVKWDDTIPWSNVPSRIAKLNTYAKDWRSELFVGGLIEIKCNEDPLNQKWMWGRVSALDEVEELLEVTYSFAGEPSVVKRAWLYGETICPAGMHTKDKSKAAAVEVLLLKPQKKAEEPRVVPSESAFFTYENDDQNYHHYGQEAGSVSTSIRHHYSNGGLLDKDQRHQQRRSPGRRGGNNNDDNDGGSDDRYWRDEDEHDNRRSSLTPSNSATVYAAGRRYEQQLHTTHTSSSPRFTPTREKPKTPPRPLTPLGRFGQRTPGVIATTTEDTKFVSDLKLIANTVFVCVMQEALNVLTDCLSADESPPSSSTATIISNTSDTKSDSNCQPHLDSGQNRSDRENDLLSIENIKKSAAITLITTIGHSAYKGLLVPYFVNEIIKHCGMRARRLSIGCIAESKPGGADLLSSLPAWTAVLDHLRHLCHIHSRLLEFCLSPCISEAALTHTLTRIETAVSRCSVRQIMVELIDILTADKNACDAFFAVFLDNTRRFTPSAAQLRVFLGTLLYSASSTQGSRLVELFETTVTRILSKILRLPIVTSTAAVATADISATEGTVTGTTAATTAAAAAAAAANVTVTDEATSTHTGRGETVDVDEGFPSNVTVAKRAYKTVHNAILLFTAVRSVIQSELCLLPQQSGVVEEHIRNVVESLTPLPRAHLCNALILALDGMMRYQVEPKGGTLERSLEDVVDVVHLLSETSVIHYFEQRYVEFLAQRLLCFTRLKCSGNNTYNASAGGRGGGLSALLSAEERLLDTLPASTSMTLNKARELIQESRETQYNDKEFQKYILSRMDGEFEFSCDDGHGHGHDHGTAEFTISDAAVNLVLEQCAVSVTVLTHEVWPAGVIKTCNASAQQYKSLKLPAVLSEIADEYDHFYTAHNGHAVQQEQNQGDSQEYEHNGRDGGQSVFEEFAPFGVQRKLVWCYGLGCVTVSCRLFDGSKVDLVMNEAQCAVLMAFNTGKTTKTVSELMQTTQLTLSEIRIVLHSLLKAEQPAVELLDAANTTTVEENKAEKTGRAQKTVGNEDKDEDDEISLNTRVCVSRQLLGGDGIVSDRDHDHDHHGDSGGKDEESDNWGDGEGGGQRVRRIDYTEIDSVLSV